MTVAADQSPGKVTKTGDGSNRVFDFSPIILLDPGTGNTNHLEVTITDSAGTETLVTEGTGTTNYSVALVSSYPSTGSITYPADVSGTALPATSTVTIKRVVPKEQGVDLENQGKYLAEVQETALDRITQILIELKEEIDRVVKVPVSDTSNLNLPSASARANKFLRFDSNGDPDVSVDANPDIATIPVSAFMETVLDDVDGDTALGTLGISTFMRTVLDETDGFFTKTITGKV